MPQHYVETGNEWTAIIAMAVWRDVHRAQANYLLEWSSSRGPRSWRKLTAVTCSARATTTSK